MNGEESQWADILELPKNALLGLAGGSRGAGQADEGSLHIEAMPTARTKTLDGPVSLHISGL